MFPSIRVVSPFFVILGQQSLGHKAGVELIANGCSPIVAHYDKLYETRLNDSSKTIVAVEIERYIEPILANVWWWKCRDD